MEDSISNVRIPSEMLSCTDENERLESNHLPFGLESLEFKLYMESVDRVRSNDFLKGILTEKEFSGGFHFKC